MVYTPMGTAVLVILHDGKSSKLIVLFQIRKTSSLQELWRFVQRDRFQTTSQWRFVSASIVEGELMMNAVSIYEWRFVLFPTVISVKIVLYLLSIITSTICNHGFN